MDLLKHPYRLYIDAQGLAAEIARAPLRRGGPSMDRTIDDIESELSKCASNCKLTLDAIALLQQLAADRRVSFAMTQDNMQIAEELAKTAKMD